MTTKRIVRVKRRKPLTEKEQQERLLKHRVSDDIDVIISLGNASLALVYSEWEAVFLMVEKMRDRLAAVETHLEHVRNLQAFGSKAQSQKK